MSILNGQTTERNISLHKNPFYVLGVTVRDGRSRVVELSEERALVAEEDACRDAQNALINLRGRLIAEMRWLPGVSPRKASELAGGIGTGRPRIITDDLPPLARANVLASYLESLPRQTDTAEATTVILGLARAAEEVDVNEVLRDINEDRSVAGYQPVRDVNLVIEEFETCKRSYRSAAGAFLDKLPSQTIATLVDTLVDRSTEAGRHHVPAVIQGIVDMYETGAQTFMERELGNVKILLERASGAISLGEANVGKIFDDIERVIFNFNEVVRPIQVTNHVNGSDHNPSLEIAQVVRNFAVGLHNEHGWLALPARITDHLTAAFPKLGLIQEAVSGDAEYLRRVAEERRVALEKNTEYERSLEYTADIGVLFKDKVSMTADAIQWQNRRLPLATITRIRWGATRHSVNGVPTGTTYMILVGDATSAMTISLRNGSVYEDLTDRLWKAVGFRLLVEHVQRLADSGSIPFAGGIIRDDGVVLRRKVLFGADETISVPWCDVTIWSQAGAFVMAKRDDRKIQASMPYQSTDNAIVIENLIRAFFKSSKPRLTQLFE